MSSTTTISTTWRRRPWRCRASSGRCSSPLRRLYNDLTGHDVTFGIPANGPYPHPQLIHYPAGGGFFARHWHNLAPQKLGFIVSLARRGRDYRNGGTGFEIEGETIDMEPHHEIGDILVWRYDHHHWVTQSDLRDKFDWSSEPDAGWPPSPTSIPTG